MASAYTDHIERNSSFDCGVAHGSYQQKLGTNLCITTGRNAQPVDAITVLTAIPKLGTSRAGLVSLDPAARSMRIPSTRPAPPTHGAPASAIAARSASSCASQPAPSRSSRPSTASVLRGAVMRGEATARLCTRPRALHRAEITGGILCAAFRMRRQARLTNPHSTRPPSGSINRTPARRRCTAPVGNEPQRQLTPPQLAEWPHPARRPTRRAVPSACDRVRRSSA
jgi:hypothetical protein